MRSQSSASDSDPREDTLAGLLDDVLRADAVLARAEVARVRALARAGSHAVEAGEGQRASVRAAEMALREVSSEIAAAAHLSDRTVQRQIDEAMTLVRDYPTTVDAWEAGALSRGHVRAIADVGTRLPVDQRHEFDVLAVAITSDGVSPGRLRSRLGLLAERLQPTTVTERHRMGRETRAVRIVPGADGMSDLIATLPTPFAVAIHDRLTQQARALIDLRDESAPTACAGGTGLGVGVASVVDPDTRTTDQVRADIFTDLLLTGAPMADPTRPTDGSGVGALGAIRARIQVVVPALTMLRPENENVDPAQLVGHGPIDAALARQIAEATATPWDRVITHPVTGAVLHTDTYHRTTAIDRYLRARDRHCRWPGCTAPAIRCEIDHTHDWALGGATDVGNLACLCQRHHTQKQFTRWTVRQLPGGVLEWTSPTGRVSMDVPEQYTPSVRFISDDDPPPGAAPPARLAAPF